MLIPKGTMGIQASTERRQFDNICQTTIKSGRTATIKIPRLIAQVLARLRRRELVRILPMRRASALPF